MRKACEDVVAAASTRPVQFLRRPQLGCHQSLQLIRTPVQLQVRWAIPQRSRLGQKDEAGAQRISV
jgi:hypothetical protein